MSVFYYCPKCKDVKVFKEEPKEVRPAWVKLNPNTVDAAKEKHVPVITKEGNKVHVAVGAVPHPMTSVHYISQILIETDKGFKSVTLTPENKPEADFELEEGEKLLAAYEYCTLHGFWSAKA